MCIIFGVLDAIHIKVMLLSLLVKHGENHEHCLVTRGFYNELHRALSPSHRLSLYTLPLYVFHFSVLQHIVIGIYVQGMRC